MIRLILVVALALALPAAGAGKEECSGPVCMVAKSANGVALIARNNGESDVWVELWFTSAVNLYAPQDRQRKRIAPGESVVMARGLRRDGQLPFGYRYKWIWTPGDPAAVHDDAYRYAIPLEEDEQPRSLAELKRHPRGAPPAFSAHEGDIVTAAREGIVVSLDVNDVAARASVRLRHSDGTLADYVFTGAALVAPTVSIRRGDPIGRVAGDGGVVLSVSKGSSQGRLERLPFLIDDGTASGCVVGW